MDFGRKDCFCDRGASFIGSTLTDQLVALARKKFASSMT